MADRFVTYDAESTNPGQVGTVRLGIEEPGQVRSLRLGIEEPGQVRSLRLGIEEPGQVRSLRLGIEEPGQVLQVRLGVDKPGEAEQTNLSWDAPHYAWRSERIDHSSPQVIDNEVRVVQVHQLPRDAARGKSADGSGARRVG